jgi:hypothetical protein
MKEKKPDDGYKNRVVLQWREREKAGKRNGKDNSSLKWCIV